MNTVGRALRSIRTKGLSGAVDTGLAFVEDVVFDWRHGTDTVTRDDLADVPETEASRSHAVPYTPTRVRAMRRCLQRFAPTPGGAFCDLGSGKGRALMLAAEHGFERVVGVEFSDSLCRVARENVSRFGARTGVTTQFEVVCTDAGRHEFRDDETFVFLFNPFASAVLEAVLTNLDRSLARAPRDLTLVYNNPVEAHLMERLQALRLTERVRLCGNDFAVYRTREVDRA